jgi:hypothetical protein
MSTLHPVHTLEASLETARLNAVQGLASKDVALSSAAVRDLAAIQSALMAVREEIFAMAQRLGGQPA